MARQRRHPVVVGVVAVQPPPAVDDGVHRADGGGFGVHFIQQGDDRLLVGDGHIDAPKVPFFQKSGQLGGGQFL